MSDFEQKVATIQQIAFNKEETEEYKVQYIKDKGVNLDEWEYSLDDCFFDHCSGYKNHTLVNDCLYKIIEEEDINSYDPISIAIPMGNNKYKIVSRWYNGVGDFSDAVEIALKKLNDKISSINQIELYCHTIKEILSDNIYYIMENDTVHKVKVTDLDYDTDKHKLFVEAVSSDKSFKNYPSEKLFKTPEELGEYITQMAKKK